MRFGFSVRMKNDPRNKFLSVRKPGTTRGIRKVPAAAVLQDLLLPDPIVISHGPYVVPREVVRILGIFSESPRENPLLPLEKFSNLSRKKSTCAFISGEIFYSLSRRKPSSTISQLCGSSSLLSLSRGNNTGIPTISQLNSLCGSSSSLSLSRGNNTAIPTISQLNPLCGSSCSLSLSRGNNTAIPTVSQLNSLCGSSSSLSLSRGNKTSIPF
ncbi:hypothetical protein AMTR_s00063p00089600 [Amborella trichopoda]|uniref:Uncharacterized protein n=1 Tax=Amborella trichopoda TaxID=13333 RepID=U5D483_AMBTC|nr:hypothetical protein AMTR_s00063p00089600 [Amborella trichopoda]